MNHPAPTEPGECPNCAAPRQGRYCSACGQKAGPLNPTLYYFLHELTHELLHVDGKIFRSVRLLLMRPGFLTKQFLAGRRASYISPIRLYLVFSVIALSLDAAKVRDLTIEYTPSPGERIDPEAQLQMERTASAVDAAVNRWLPRAMFFLVPLFAVLVMLVRCDSGLHYPQHLYFALHVQAFHFFLRSISSVVAALNTTPSVLFAASLLTTLGSIAYFVAAFRTVYGASIWGSIWRCIIVSMLYFLASVLVVLAITLPFWRDLVKDGS